MMNKEKKKIAITVPHPLSGSSFTNLLTLFLENGHIDPSHFGRALQTLLTSLAISPLELLEKIRFGQRIENTEIDHPPIFILGHWRSGTTHLHRLMIQDKNYACISSFDAFLPQSSLAMNEVLKSQLQKLWLDVRVMDNVSYSPDVPEEEEYALGNILPLSFYHCWFFPQQMERIFKQSVLLEGIPFALKQKWKQTYVRLLKKATLIANGKRLLLKNPANTSRIEELLELFPNAKFIHIYRNPYDTYTSTKRFYEKLLPHYTFQSSNSEAIEANILLFYRQLMEKYFESVKLIPKGNFVEIRYEDLEGNELEVLKQIYKTLNLPGFKQAEEQFKTYISAQSNYQKNEYTLDEATRHKIEQHWQFAIDHWNRLDPCQRSR